MKSFLDRDFVKLGNFQNNPRKIVSYAYLLTAKGIEEKSRLSVRFVISRLNEYDRLQQVFTEKLADILRDGHTKIIIVGPKIIREFLVSILREKHTEITLVGDCTTWKDIDGFDPSSYDLVVLFDESEEGTRDISAATGIPTKKLMSLW